ncbi:hypothetical protein CSC70_03195 [Pseudoxanthomonas kalamensis DSM 18571]|nr:hypothetical protein CSC70_03195 [Pseudoxanthomonas kalamensis DSM 18571]
MKQGWLPVFVAWGGLLVLPAFAAMAGNAGIVRVTPVNDTGNSAQSKVDSRQEQGSELAVGWSLGNGTWEIETEPGIDTPLLVISHAYSARVGVQEGDGAWHEKSVFDAELDAGFSRQALVFPLGVRGPVRVRVENARYPPRVAVVPQAAYQRGDQRHLRNFMLVAGVLVGLALTVLLFWVMLREAVYLLYTVTLSLQTLSLLYLSGEGYAMPVLRQLAPLGTYGVWIVSVLAMVSATMLLLAYAGMRWRVPRISQAMRWLGIYLPMLLLLLQALPWLQAKGWLPNASNALFVASSALGIVGLYAAWRKGGRHAGILLIAWVPMVLFIAARTVQLESQRPMPGWMEYGMPLMLAFTGVVMALGLADRTLTMRRERDSAKEHAERDYLTGVLNRGGIEYRLDWAIINTRREGLPLSVLFMDIDHFKRVNDHHGHGVGDSCLRAVVRAISEELHYGDQLGRLGGEEFVLGLPGADGEDALQTAERLRRKIESNCREVEGAPVYITVSIGVAESNPADTVASLIRRADQAMYAAKHAGRNRVV